MRLLQLGGLLLLSVTTIAEYCQIAANTPTAKGRAIDVTCEPGMNFSLKLEDEEELSTLEVFGNTMEEGFDKLLKAERYGKSSNMSLTLFAKTLDQDGEEDNSAEQSLEDLLENPYLTSFPAVARLIHDELQFRGWESPSVMMLYHIGMSLPDHPPSRKRREAQYITHEEARQLKKYGHSIDDRLDDYHGPNRELSCANSGSWRIKSTTAELEAWKHKKCFGMCGKKCSCWKWVCGDCCINRGCKIHDGYCEERWWGRRCLLGEGAIKIVAASEELVGIEYTVYQIISVC